MITYKDGNTRLASDFPELTSLTPVSKVKKDKNFGSRILSSNRTSDQSSDQQQWISEIKIFANKIILNYYHLEMLTG
jgi:hypothetical protein